MKSSSAGLVVRMYAPIWFAPNSCRVLTCATNVRPTFHNRNLVPTPVKPAAVAAIRQLPQSTPTTVNRINAAHVIKVPRVQLVTPATQVPTANPDIPVRPVIRAKTHHQTRGIHVALHRVPTVPFHHRDLLAIPDNPATKDHPVMLVALLNPAILVHQVPPDHPVHQANLVATAIPEIVVNLVDSLPDRHQVAHLDHRALKVPPVPPANLVNPVNLVFLAHLDLKVTMDHPDAMETRDVMEPPVNRVVLVNQAVASTVPLRVQVRDTRCTTTTPSHH